jgi:tetratricopeptide (TPR) repeat protein
MVRIRFLIVLSLVFTSLLSFRYQAQVGRPEQEKPSQIDILDYHVEAELEPSSHQLKAKAVLKLVPLENSVRSAIFDFNANLQVQRVYFTDKPPAPSEKQFTESGSEIHFATEGATGKKESVATRTESGVSGESDVPYLSRRKAKKPAGSAVDKESTDPSLRQPEGVVVLRTEKNRPGSKSVQSAGKEAPSNLLRFTRFEEDHTIQVEFNRVLERSLPVSLTFEYEGALKSAENSPLEGVQLATISENFSYLLAMSRWFPTNQYLKDRATGLFRISVPQGFVVAMDGQAKPKEQRAGREIFTFLIERATFPGSLSVAKYNEIPVTTGKTELVFYVRDNKRDFVDSQAEMINKILDLYSLKFGAPPFKTLKIALIDDSSLLGYPAPGIEFLAERAFDRPPNTNLLAREIAYQWWQNLIIPKTPQDLWLKEGFANYSALLFQESVSGEAGFSQELKDTAVASLLHEEKSTIRNAYQLQLYSPEYNSILKSKGAYVLHMLRSVLGDDNFFKVLKEYVYTFGFQEASIQDFKKLAEKISSQDLTYFFSEWIDQNGVPQIQYDYTTYRTKDGFKVTGTIKQDMDTFRMPVEFLIETEGKPEIKKVEVIGPETNFSVNTFGKPRKAVIDPNNKLLRISDELKVSIAIARGEELKRLGESSDAIAEFQKAIELNKRSSLAYFKVGEALFEQRSYNSAANSFREALNGNLEPKWIEVWCHINLGKIYDVLGQRERALGEYQKAVDTNDNAQNAQEIAQKYIQEPYKYEGKTEMVQ